MKEQKRNDTYDSILESAIELISTSGVGGVSASKLSKLSGISKSSIFHYFDHVNEIPLQVMVMVFEKMKQPIQKIEATSLQSYLMQLGNFTIQIDSQLKKLYMCILSFYHESLFKEDYRKVLEACIESSVDDLTAKINHYLDAKNQVNVRSCAISLLSSLDGIGLHVMLREEKTEYLAAWKIQVKAICKKLEH